MSACTQNGTASLTAPLCAPGAIPFCDVTASEHQSRYSSQEQTQNIWVGINRLNSLLWNYFFGVETPLIVLGGC